MAALTPVRDPEIHAPEALLARARSGDHDAFAGLVERHEAMVFSIALHFFGDRAHAEEIAQDVFLQLYRNLESIETDSHALFWLRQVVSRRCIDEVRKRRLRLVSFEEAGEVPASASNPDPLRDRRLRRLIGELPEVQRLVVTLRYQEDLGPSEICEVLGIPVNTVKSHLQRALAALRRKLEGS